MTGWYHSNSLSIYYGDGFRYEVTEYINSNTQASIGWFAIYRSYRPGAMEGFFNHKLRLTRFTDAAPCSSREEAQVLCERHYRLMVLQ
jgi:hypothetical protein